MIVDSFTFFNEISLCYLRMEELNDVVDYFLIVESAQSFSGKSKPLVYADHEKMFSRWAHKIVYFPLPGLPPLIHDTEENRFWLEAYQRNQLLAGLMTIPGINFNDLILISDVDEIPRAESVLAAPNNLLNHDAIGFRQDGYNYNLKNLTHNNSWVGTCAVKYGIFSKTRPHEVRTDVRMNRTLDINYLDNAGWHLSYFGGDAVVRKKVRSFSHGAPNVVGNKDIIDVTDGFPIMLLNNSLISKDEMCEIISIAASRNFDIPPKILSSLGRYANFFK